MSDSLDKLTQLSDLNDQTYNTIYSSCSLFIQEARHRLFYSSTHFMMHLGFYLKYRKYLDSFFHLP